MPRRIVILGGYGAFGERVARRLMRGGQFDLVIAGRSQERAHAFATSLGAEAVQMDGRHVTAGELRALAPHMLINASGPFQDQDYSLALACIAAGVHYCDLADARAFAVGIGALDAAAKAAGVLVVSGASTVPAVSAAVVDCFTSQFAQLRAITTIIAPGNSFDPGVATTRSFLQGLGRPIAAAGGETTAAYGWQRLERRVIPGLGPRWTGDCDAPDRELFPRRYRGVQSARVCAALEVGAFHLSLWALSGLVRAGLLRSPERLARPFGAMKRRLGFLGSDTGGMMVVLEGEGHDGAPKRLTWSLVAKSGHGPDVPATPSVILAKKLMDGSLTARGATPCVGLFSLEDFMSDVDDLDITAAVT